MIDSKFIYSARVFEGAEPSDLSYDYTLPDYMPAIGKVISCTASVAPPALYLAGGSIEAAGGVRYRLLYESAEDGSLWCSELPAEYDIFANPERGSNVPADPSELSGLIEAKAENVTARVTAPRRLSIKSRIRLYGSLAAPKEYNTELRGDTSASSAVKTLSGEAKCGMSVSSSSAPITCHDTVSRPEAGLSDSDEVRIISARGDVMIKNTEYTGHTVECRGDLCVTLLFIREGEGERPRRLARKIPFSASIDLPEEEGTHIGIRACGYCPNVTATTDEIGISIEADIILCAESAAQTKVTYLKDVYSQTADCETSKEYIILRTPAACFNGNASISASASLSELGLDSGMKICDHSAKIIQSEYELSERGKFVMTGKIKVNLLADTGAELIPSEFESDIKYTAELPEASGITDPETEAFSSLCDMKCRIDGDRIYTDCELLLSVKTESKEKAELISEVNFISSPATERSSSQILICYPEGGKTLWDIAKHYRADVEELAEKNSISATSPEALDSLKDNKYLII